MTHDDKHAERPAGPTPEEISARLEALLKRTHALRQAQAATDADTPHDVPTWPPHEADLDAVEVVAVPVALARGRDTAQDDPAATPADAEEARPSASSEVPASTTVDRPDWSTLRLRDTPTIEPPATPSWVWWAIAALVIALGAESAYLLRTAPWARDGAAATPATLRLEGSPQVRVRVNDQAAQALPLEQTIDGGVLVVAVDVVSETPDVAGEPGRPPVDGAPAPSTTALPAAAGATAASAGISATTGAVLVESTPPGAIVTMEGYERGPTPITIGSLRPGRHDVLVVGNGWRRALKVDITAGTTARLVASGASQP